MDAVKPVTRTDDPAQPTSDDPTARLSDFQATVSEGKREHGTEGELVDELLADRAADASTRD